MPPSPGDAPSRTPDRKSSSSAILQAFRNLTAGRPKSASQASVQTPGLTAVHPDFTRSDVVQELANKRSFSEHDTRATTLKLLWKPATNPLTDRVIGAPPELAQLKLQLDSARPLSERVAAVSKICELLDHYRVNNPMLLWAAGQDLLVNESLEASRAGHCLLVSLANSTDLTPVERSTFFESIRVLDDNRNVALRFQALLGMTSRGRNVEAIESYLAPFVAQLLMAHYKIVFKVRKAERRTRGGSSAEEEKSFEGLFQFVVDMIKFNSRLFAEYDYGLLLNQVICICRESQSQSDLENSINVINALITYTEVPISSIKPCLDLLSDIYVQIRPLKDETWNALSNIFHSHLAETAITIYMSQFQAIAENSMEKQTNRGAFRVVTHLFELDGQNEFPRISLHRLLPAIWNALRNRDRKFAADVLVHIKTYFADPGLLIVLKQEHEWDDFVDIIVECKKLSDLSPVSSNSGAASVISDDRSTMSGKTSWTEREDGTPAQNLEYIVSSLSAIFPELDVLHQEAIVRLYFGLGSGLSNFAAEILVKQCVEDRLLFPSNPNWLQNFKDITSNFLHDRERPSHLRSLVVRILREAHYVVEFVSPSEYEEMALHVLANMKEETDDAVLEDLASFAVAVVERADDELFATILSIFHDTVFQEGRLSTSMSQSFSPTALYPVGGSAYPKASLCRIAARNVIRMFIGNANKSATKAEALFDFVRKVAASNECAIDARICSVKLLFRLRATSDYAIYIRPLSESEGVAAVLCRTAESASLAAFPDDVSPRDLRNASNGGIQTSRSKTFNVKRPVPPLWFYPGPKGLPDEPPHEPSRCIYSFLDPSVEAAPGRVALKFTHWLETIIDLLQQQDTDWEVYSYVVVHLGAQLSNQNLFRGAIPQIKFLRSVLCDQIRSSSFHDPPSYTSLKKADVAICLFHVQTMLVSYHSHYARSEEDELVRSFILGIGSWDRTSKWCIHALTVCCHELPLSVSKHLDNILQKMSQIITQPQIAIHILEFLVMLARLPELYKNFREDEYKLVFGVSFRYLQHAKEQQFKGAARESISSSISRPGRMRHSDSIRELRMLHDQDASSKARPGTEDFPQYVYALAYHVITFWYMNLKLQDRPMYRPWIAEKLTYTDNHGKELVEDQALVTMDMMDKIAYSDRDETKHDPSFAKETDGEVAQQTWVIGYSLLTVETAGRTGLSQITRRRPSGTKYFIFRPALTSPPRHQVPLTTGLAAEQFYTSSYIGVLPEDVMQEFYSSYNVHDPRAPYPIPLPANDEAVARAIRTFDRNPTVDGHRVGVIYMAEGQNDEVEILQNTYGSADYTSFIEKLGFLTRVTGAKFSLQGLDQQDGIDGEYTYCWRDRATEIIFHIPTMMPTDLKNDPRCNNKKRHIGNDFVNIIWNESGHPFDFDTFPSQFNYVYIVITPETKHSFTSLRDKDHMPHLFYKVQVLSQPGFPEISPAAETKVLNGNALPDFVRLLALNASVFSLVWKDREGGEHVSPWRNRLREIKRLRERYASHGPPTLSHYGSGSSPSPVNGPSSMSNNIPPSTQEKTLSDANKGLVVMSPPQNRERGTSALSSRISMATFSGSDNLSHSSLTASSRGDGNGNDTD
ncbi:hypothetical protein Vi05172_g2545 [Venturia inaequalis]|uniref:Rap-GAP domain-containing protein n=1 Tax=Venturia inaequalis TaxID=5025 RepID=A0A8H3UZ85_VENIN|nr:hypothetical protein EG327_007166 [Venturia inaequalis]RDI87513.1 hypothetical protein Vi05172_g2545 [Venturia inaequalis]